MSIKSSLRALSYKEASLDDTDEFQTQLSHETNDRGACILMATNVEIALNRAVFRVLEWDETTYGHLTSAEGPAGSFAQKIHLGRALRIYGEDTQHNLDYIRLIRNAFAHTHAPISFETKEVKDAVGLLKQVPAMPPVGVAAYVDYQASDFTSRNSFKRACDVAAHNLMVWGISGLHEKHPSDNGKSDEHREFLWRKPLP
jgi:hypothetical protein